MHISIHILDTEYMKPKLNKIKNNYALSAFRISCFARTPLQTSFQYFILFIKCKSFVSKAFLNSVLISNIEKSSQNNKVVKKPWASTLPDIQTRSFQLSIPHP